MLAPEMVVKNPSYHSENMHCTARMIPSLWTHGRLLEMDFSVTNLSTDISDICLFMSSLKSFQNRTIQLVRCGKPLVQYSRLDFL
jgi:hypothetical protein